MKQLFLLLVMVALTVTSILTVALVVALWPILPLFGLVMMIVLSIAIGGGVIWLLAFGFLHLRGMALRQRLLHTDEHRLAYHDQGRVIVLPTVAALPAPLQPSEVRPIEDKGHLILPTAPPYRTIAHLVAPGRLILGYSVNGAIYGDITDLLSTAIVGRPGTGKSTMLRFVCAQILRIDGLPIIFDPHGSIVDELGNLLHCAESASDIASSAAWLDQELDRRLTARRQGQATQQPLLLLADEWPVIAAMSD
jgi:hypothetical protein